MDGYYSVRLIDTTNSNAGAWVRAWQRIKDGQQAGYVDDNGVAITAPAKHECHLLSDDLHFAPAVLTDPATTYTPPTIAEYQAAVAAGTVHELVAKSVEAAKAQTVVDVLADPAKAATISLPDDAAPALVVTPVTP